MTTTNDGGPVHPMVMKAAKSLFYSLTGVSADEDPDEWDATCYGYISDAQAALTACGALEPLEALEKFGKAETPEDWEQAESASASAIAKVYGSAPE
jgi:hypothetical protein